MELGFWSFLFRNVLIGDLVFLDFEFNWLFDGSFLVFFVIVLLECILIFLVLIWVNFFIMFNNCNNCGGMILWFIVWFLVDILCVDLVSFNVSCKKRL